MIAISANTAKMIALSINAATMAIILARIAQLMAEATREKRWGRLAIESGALATAVFLIGIQIAALIKLGAMR